MLRPRLRIPRAPRVGMATSSPSPFLRIAPAQRSVHTVPDLAYPFNEQEKLPENGTTKGNPLLSKPAFDVAWTEYQSFVLDKLNKLTVGTEWESKDIKTTLLETAREPSLASIFNHASVAHNNHFFFRHLAGEKKEMPSLLSKHLKGSFGSIETLRREMVYTAMAMFGPGFVWLVKVDQPGMAVAFKVVSTYLAGSPYPGAHWRRQDVDLNTAVGSSPEGIRAAKTYLENTAYGTGKQTPEARKRLSFAPGGTDVVPLLCLNTWEHVYMPDYGVSGKDQFVSDWWDYIDWPLVAEEANLRNKGLTS